MDKLINEFSAGLFFWQIILFILLLLLLRKFAWKPILKAVEQREEGIRNALAAAEDAKKEMQNVTADSEKLLQEARAERPWIRETLKDINAVAVTRESERGGHAAHAAADDRHAHAPLPNAPAPRLRPCVHAIVGRCRRSP